MMRLKNIAAIMLLMTCAACKKSFLEIPSQTTLTTTVYFKTLADFQAAINGAYAPLRNIYSTAAAMGENRSDNTRYDYNPAKRGLIDHESIADFVNLNTNGTVGSKYVNDYLVIARVNQILALIDGVDFDSAAKANIKGQAYFLRGLCYFDLVQYFGPVPLHLTPATTLDQTALPKSSVADIYTQIISDVQKAAATLPLKGSQASSDLGRATSGAAQTLLGNVYAVLKRWSDAETVLKAVIASNQYSLITNYASVFSPTNKNNSESVFEIQYKEGTEGYGSPFAYIFMPQPITGAEVTAITGVAGEPARTEDGYNIPTPDLIADYETGDMRKAASIGTVIAGGISYPYILKYNHPHTMISQTNDDWPVYRYSEVLLLLAEALNEQSRGTEALPYLNQVRARAGLGPILVTTGLSDVIFHERRVELAFENKRWLDLVRTGRAVSVMTAFGAKVKANPQAYYFPAGYAPIPSAFTTISLTFPIPASELALNPNL